MWKLLIICVPLMISADPDNPRYVKLIPYEIMEPPQLHPMLDHHVVNTSDNWRIRCAGHSPLEWSYPSDEAAQRKPLSGRVTIDEEKIPGDSPRPFISHLNVADVQYSDAGYYYCRYKGTSSNEYYPNVTSTYLYTMDEDYLFDSTERFTWANILQYAETVLPCKPTDPSVKMSFFKDSKDITDSLESMLFKYDPKRGLIVTRGTLTFHSGMLKCQAKRGDLVDNYNVIMQFQQIDTPPPPLILDPEPNNIHVGGKMKMACQLPVDRSMPHTELEWGLPSEIDPDSKRIVIGDQKRERIGEDSTFSYLDPSEHILITKYIIVDPVEMSDKGLYTCKAVVVGTDKKSTDQTYHLSNILLDPDQAYIGTPMFHGDPIITVYKSMSVFWIFNIGANPDPGFTWYHPSGHEIDYSLLEKYEMDIFSEEDKIKLAVENVELEDTGEYIFNIEVMGKDMEFLEKNVSLILR